jgi:hypothetical protein
VLLNGFTIAGQALTDKRYAIVQEAVVAAQRRDYQVTHETSRYSNF